MARTVPNLPKLDLSAYLKHERADAAQNRQAILEAAEDALVTTRIQDLAMTDLARRVGIGQGTLYRRFESKRDLSKALLVRHMLALEAQLARRNETMEETPEALLLWFTDLAATVTTDKADLITASTTAEDKAPGWWMGTELVTWTVDSFAALLSAATGRPDAGDLARVVVTVLVFPGPLGSPQEVTAERARVRGLVETFLGTSSDT